jgi:hypothetical protein
MLVVLDCLNEIRRFDQTLVGTGIQLGEALSEKLNIQFIIVQIDPVQIGNLQFTAGTWF